MQTDRHEDRVGLPKRGRPFGLAFKDKEGNPVGYYEWRRINGFVKTRTLTPHTKQYLLNLTNKYNYNSIDDTIRRIIKEWIEFKKARRTNDEKTNIYL